MKELFSNYKAFTPKWYRIWRCYIALFLWVGHVFLMGSDLGIFTIMAMAWSFSAFEAIADYLVFQGINCKDTKSYGFLQSSKDGIRRLRNVIYMDIIRRFLILFIPFVLIEGWVVYLKFFQNVVIVDNSMMTWLLMDTCYLPAVLLVLFGATTWCVFIGRFFTGIQIVISFISIGASISLMGVAFSLMFSPYILVIGIILSISSVITTVVFTNKKLKGVYYDERF